MALWCFGAKQFCNYYWFWWFELCYVQVQWHLMSETHLKGWIANRSAPFYVMPRPLFNSLILLLWIPTLPFLHSHVWSEGSNVGCTVLLCVFPYLPFVVRKKKFSSSIQLTMQEKEMSSCYIGNIILRTVYNVSSDLSSVNNVTFVSRYSSSVLRLGVLWFPLLRLNYISPPGVEFCCTVLRIKIYTRTQM